MPLCPRCSNPFVCNCATQSPKELGEVSKECPLEKPGQIWVHVLDDRGIDVDKIETTADRSGQPTNAAGTAVFTEVSPGPHTVALDTTASAERLEAYEALTEPTSRTVVVAAGQIAYAPYQLTRKPELSVLVVQKDKPERLFNGADVRVTGPLNVSELTQKGRVDFGRLPAGPYTITVTLESEDAKTFTTTKDFGTDVEKATLSAPGEKRLVTVVAEPLNIVTSHVAIEKAMLIIDHGPDSFESETTCVTLSLTQTSEVYRYDQPLTLTCVPESDATVDVFWDEACSDGEKVGGALDAGFLPEAKQKELRDGKTVKLWVRATAGPGKITVSLALEQPPNRFVRLGDLAPPVEAEVQVLARPHVNIQWLDDNSGVDKVKVKLTGDGFDGFIPDSLRGLAKWAERGIKPGRYACAFTFPGGIPYLLYDEDGAPVDGPALDLKPGGKPVTFKIKKGQVTLAATCDTAGKAEDVSVQVKVKLVADAVKLEKKDTAVPVVIPYTEIDQKCEIEALTPDGNDVYEMLGVEPS